MIKQSERLRSLDVFRGGVLAGFIIQNNTGSNDYIYSQLLHSTWNGWTIADLGFPFFLFIVGVAISYSIGKLIENNEKKSLIYRKVIVRSCTLFVLGLVFENFHTLVLSVNYSWESFSTVRIMGVLQRIALTYLIATILIIECRKFKTIFFWTLTLLIGYWVLMMLVPVPGYGAGHLSKEGNLATYLDQLIMSNNLWKNGSFDPEGLLSTIPATASVLIGCLAGKILQSDCLQVQKSRYLLSAGFFCICTGLVASLWFPINKSLWTSSYVLFTGGLALFILAILYIIIEINKFEKWAGLFDILGRNCLMVFLFSSLLTILINYFPLPFLSGGANLRLVMYYHVFLPVASPEMASLLYGIVYLIFWSLLMWYLKKKNIRLVA